MTETKKIDPKAIRARATEAKRLLRAGDFTDPNDAMDLVEDVDALLLHVEELEKHLHPLQAGTFTAGQFRELRRFSDDPRDPLYWLRVERDEHGLVALAEESIFSRGPTAQVTGTRSLLELTSAEAWWAHGALGHILGGGVGPAPGVRVCVAVVVSDAEGRFILGRRKKAPHEGKWSLPAGGIEPGETCAEAARREVREETGLDAEISSITHHLVIDVIEHRVVLIVIHAAAFGTPTGNSDLLEPNWFEPYSLPLVEQLSPPTLHILQRLGLLRDARSAEVTSTPGVQGGSPRIAGTRIQVSVLLSCRRSGWDDAKILEQYPTLTQRQLDAAWAYVAAHPEDFAVAEEENAP